MTFFPKTIVAEKQEKITFIRMVIDGKTFKDMEIFELDRYKVI